MRQSAGEHGPTSLLRNAVFDRVRLVWRALGWPLLALTGAVALGLGIVGYATKRPDPFSLPGAFYATLQLFVFEYNGPAAPPWQIEVARFLAPAVAGFAAVKAFLLVFGEQLLRLRLRRGHVVVCGFGEKGRAFTKSLRARGYKVVGIETAVTDDAAAAARDLHVPLLGGDAREPALLRKARVHLASHLVAVCGDDGTNAEVAVASERLVRGSRAGTLSCHVHIVDPALCRLLMSEALSRRRTGTVRLEFFNVFADGARAMLSDNPPDLGAEGDGTAVHMAVVGFDAFGEALTVAAVRGCEWRVPTRRLVISIIDPSARTNAARVQGRCGSDAERCDLRVIASGTPMSDEMDELGGLIASAGAQTPIDVVYVCLPDERDALRAALVVRHSMPGVRIVVRMMQSTGLATLLASDGPAAGIIPFPLDRVCSVEVLLSGPLESIARQLHEEYRRAKHIEGETYDQNSVLVPWDELDESVKEANRDQAAHIGAKLAAIGAGLVPLSGDASRFAFTSEEVEQLAEMEHERWMEEKARSGWRPGPTRDVGKKRTPYLVAWDELGDDIRDYDRMFIVNLPGFLARAGFAIERLRSVTGPHESRDPVAHDAVTVR